jgi:Putative Ig domain
MTSQTVRRRGRIGQRAKFSLLLVMPLIIVSLTHAGCGNLTSSVSERVVHARPLANSAPSITSQPMSQTIGAGQMATFSVSASGTDLLSYRWKKNGMAITGATASGIDLLHYQWRKNGMAITGSTSSSYTTPVETMSDNLAQFVVVVSNSEGSVTSHAAILIVNAAASAGALKIATASLPGGQIGSGYQALLTASDGTAPYTWGLSSGSLPIGLSLSAGTISGTPAIAGTSSFVLSVTDSSTPVPQTFKQSLSINIATSVSPLQVTTNFLPNDEAGSPYSISLSATGGTSAYTWSISSGTLPSGLTLNPSTGTISGTPTVAGALNFTVQVRDSTTPAAQMATKPLGLTVLPVPLVITTSALPGDQQGNAYAATLSASGGASPYTWSISSGTLPAGLTLNPSSGAISGIPTASGTSTFNVTVTDSTTPTHQTNTASFSITITIGISHSVVLTWAASPSSATSGYNVYRSNISGSGYTKISSTPVSGLTYTDVTVASAHTYYYVMTAVDSVGDESDFSVELQEVVP